MQPVTAGRASATPTRAGQYLITGTSDANGLLFDGTIAGVGTSYAVNYPSAATTSVYGPDNLGGGDLRLVGSYKNADAATAAVTVNGFLFEGTTADSRAAPQLPDDRLSRARSSTTSTARWAASRSATTTARRPRQDSLPLGPGHAFLYDIAHEHVPDRHRLSRLDEQHRLRHLVQRRHELHDLRRLQPRPGQQFRRSGSADRPGLPGRLRLRDRQVHPLDVVRLPERRPTSSPISRASAASRRASTR